MGILVNVTLATSKAMVAVAAPDVKILVEALVAVMHQTELTELTKVVILVALEAFR